MSFKYSSLANFSLNSTIVPVRSPKIDLAETKDMDRSAVQYFVKLNYPNSIILNDVDINDKFLSDAMDSIYDNSHLDVIYFSYSRELDYFLYIVDLNGKLVFSGFAVGKDELGNKTIITDKYPLSKLRTYSPKSIVLIDETKEYKSRQLNEKEGTNGRNS